MQVSSVLPNKLTIFGYYNENLPAPSNDDSGSNKSSASSKKQHPMVEVYDNINEWKNFCHKQILANNIDFIA